MIPYAPSRLYEPDSTIIQLIQRAGAQRADAQRRSGELWGGAVSGIGQLAAGTLRDIAERRDFDRASAAKAEAEAPRLADEAKLRGLNITKAERELSTADDEAATAERLGALFAGDAPPTPNQIMGVMAKQPQRGLEIVKGLGALQEGSEKKYRDQMTLLRDAVRGVAATPDALKPQAWQMARGNLLSRNLITEDMAPAEYTPDGLASVLNFGQEPAKPSEPKVVAGALVDNTGKVIYQAPREPKEPKAAPNKIWVMRPGTDGKMQTVFVPETEVRMGDQPANTRSGEGRPSLGGEKSALGFFNRAKQADEELAKMTGIADKNLGEQAWMKFAPNFMQTQEGQAYLQAQRAFTEARLRKDSGAAIPETEFENDRRTYFVQPGDSKETMQQKERGRAAVLASLAFQSGRALNEFYGEDAEPMLESFKKRQTVAPAPSPQSPSGASVTLPDGRVKTFPSKAAADAFKKAAGL